MTKFCFYHNFDQKFKLFHIKKFINNFIGLTLINHNNIKF